MTDLTAIKAPLGLLDPEVREALVNHGGPYEVFFNDGSWRAAQPGWDNDALVVRVRLEPPKPPKPKEFWIVIRPGRAPNLYTTKVEAEESSEGLLQIIHVREVIE